MSRAPDTLDVPGLAFASLTDVGRVRKNNEDAIGDPRLLGELVGPSARLVTRGVLLAVADGMGGHAHGEVASRLALETLFRSFYAAEGLLPEDLRLAVVAANEAVHRSNSGREEAPGRHDTGRMGTTLVAALLVGSELHVANVGDSRACRLHHGALSQLSLDHSFLAEELRAGVLSEVDAQRLPYRNVLTRAIGSHALVEVDVFSVPWLPGDRLLLCSDGLHGVVPDDLVREALLDLPPEDAARTLIRMANARGGPDNVSVVVAAQGDG